MRRVELLITEIRELTGNQRANAQSGVSQIAMVRALKNAQDATFKAIVGVKSDMFLTDKTESIVPNQESYSYPFDIYLQNIESVQWSSSLTNDGWINLFRGNVKDRQSVDSGYPFAYIPKSNAFLVSPPITNGALRVSYIKKLPQLEKRSGRITAVTTTLGQITAITIDAAESSFDRDYLNTVQKCCVVGKYGEIKVRGIEFDTISAGGVFTLSPHTLLSGETVNTGDYIVAGDYSQNISLLPDICESHLIKHAIYEIRYGDYSNWTTAALNDLQLSLSTILDNFANDDGDVIEIPITNTDYM